MNRCRSCKKPVLWTRTSTGKNHPLDFAPVPNGPWIVVDETMQRSPGPATAEDTRPRYTSHFATCEYAAQHRRPR